MKRLWKVDPSSTWRARCRRDPDRQNVDRLFQISCGKEVHADVGESRTHDRVPRRTATRPNRGSFTHRCCTTFTSGFLTGRFLRDLLTPDTSRWVPGCCTHSSALNNPNVHSTTTLLHYPPSLYLTEHDHLISFSLHSSVFQN